MKMLSPSSRTKIKEILTRVAEGKFVSLNERLFLHKVADIDQSVHNWLKRARRLQQKESLGDSIDELLVGLDLDTVEPNASVYQPEREDLGDWFTGAPSWLSRS